MRSFLLPFWKLEQSSESRMQAAQLRSTRSQAGSVLLHPITRFLLALVCQPSLVQQHPVGVKRYSESEYRHPGDFPHEAKDSDFPGVGVDGYCAVRAGAGHDLELADSAEFTEHGYIESNNERERRR